MSSPSTAGSESSLEIESATPSVAQNFNPLSESDSGSDNDSETHSDQSQDNPPRPNRFSGSRQRWRSYTAVERQIAASLEQMESLDLAAHLYNAHALKRRARRSASENEDLRDWHGKDRWLKSQSELQFQDALGLTQTELVPSNAWTAWPLPPTNYAASRRQYLENTADAVPGEWVIGGVGERDVGEALGEEMLAVFLRLARSKWISREEEASSDIEKPQISQTQSQSRSKSASPHGSCRSASPKTVSMTGSDTYAKPTILADDELAQKLLQPTIHSMLSQLDHLARAVRRTRLNHFKGAISDGMSTGSEYATDAGSVTSTPRSSRNGRAKTPRKSKSSADRKESAFTLSSPTNHALGGERTKKQSSRDAEPTSESDTAMDYASDSAQSPSIVHTRKRQRSLSSSRGHSSAYSRYRLGLMDWSEILGLAAVTDWDKGAIARTAQRCAGLFGESMSFMQLKDDPASDPLPQRVSFAPSTIPAPDALLAPKQSIVRRPYFQFGTLRCPHAGCYGSEKDFPRPYRVVEHCMRAHGYDPRKDKAEENNKHGGVHIDGFLQPLTLKRGWLGLGRQKGKKADQE